MGSVVSSCVFDIDATIVDSYSGSGQAWDNIEPNPADGSSQTANDFHIGPTSGSEATDPTFTGTAGDAGAYFSYDGADYNLFQNSITTFLDGLHKTTGGSDYTVMVAFHYITGSNQILFGNRQAVGANVGILFWMNAATDTIRHTQRGDSAATTVFSTGTISGGADHIVGMAHDHSGNNTKFWVGSSTAETPQSQTYNTTTTAASGAPSIGAYSNGTLPAANGTRIYAVSVFNEYFDDTKAAEVFNQYRARHNRVY